ncbi:TPA: hypothetical protein I8W54_000160 [Morganella morganii]|uniref:hypothetical protein n=1 Tax=Morganella sp. GD04133 TaxID=2975435 RepID=UPI001A22A8F2|nr:hypothetical protein [Morganella sp. GD04133]MDH0357017.1 hypothetical protein [Morganella sp. GD04133]HAT1511891.1 hypothetical protein [Morganella morganii]
MTREQLLQQIYFSYKLNSIVSVTFNRIDKILSFLLLLLGSSVIGSLGNNIFLGLCIATITAVRMAWPLEKTAENARKQSVAYLNLYTVQATFDSDEKLTNALTLIQKDDLIPWWSLYRIAEISYQDDFGIDHEFTLSTLEKSIAFFSGITFKKKQ